MKVNKKITYLIIAAINFLIATQPVNGQQSFLVNLETVLKLAGANNLTVQEYQLKYQQALANQSKAKEWWLPELYAGATTHYLNGAAMNADGKIFTGVNRNNLWAGLGLAAEIDFRKGIYPSMAAKQRAEAAAHFSRAERNQVILRSIHAYYDLQAEQLKYIFLQDLVNQADTLSQQIKVKVDAGLLYQSDYLLSQGNYNHLRITMLQAKVDWQRRSALLANLLNLEKNTGLVSADTSLTPLQLEPEIFDTSGVAKQPEFLGLEQELRSFQTLRKTETTGLLLPKLRIGMDNGAFGMYAGPVYNTYQINASLTWSLPLGRLTYKGDLKQWDSKIALQQNKVEQFKNQYQEEVSNAMSQLQIANEQINIAKSALQSSSEALYQGIERQKLGTAKAFEVFQAQQFFLQAQIDYLQAVAEHNKAQYALKAARGEIL